MATPHDNLFRDTFGQPEHAAPLLRALLPPALGGAIEWNSLAPARTEQVDEEQQDQRTDQLFTVLLRGRSALLYVLFEHTVRPSRWVALQVLGYMVGVWKDLRRRRRPPRLLPPILPVVVSFGARRWRATTDLASLFELGDLPAGLQRILLAALPRFRFAPHDFARKTAAEIRAMRLSAPGLSTVAAEQFVAPVGHDDDAAVRAIVAWADVLRRLLHAPTGQAGFAAVSSYILKVTKLGRRRLGAVFEQHIGAASMKKFESTYDRITRESRAEGEAKGETQGRIATLLRLLAKRFGPLPATIQRRLRTATAADLDCWTDRILEAENLEEVFAR